MARPENKAVPPKNSAYDDAEETMMKNASYHDEETYIKPSPIQLGKGNMYASLRDNQSLIDHSSGQCRRDVGISHHADSEVKGVVALGASMGASPALALVSTPKTRSHDAED